MMDRESIPQWYDQTVDCEDGVHKITNSDHVLHGKFKDNMLLEGICKYPKHTVYYIDLNPGQAIIDVNPNTKLMRMYHSDIFRTFLLHIRGNELTYKQYGVNEEAYTNPTCVLSWSKTEHTFAAFSGCSVIIRLINNAKEYIKSRQVQSMIAPWCESFTKITINIFPYGRIKDMNKYDFKDESKETDICVVCMERKSDMAFVDCGHLCACGECVKTLQKCPICRGEGKTLKIFRS